MRNKMHKALGAGIRSRHLSTEARVHSQTIRPTCGIIFVGRVVKGHARARVCVCVCASTSGVSCQHQHTSFRTRPFIYHIFNTLNAQLNSICQFLTLLGAHPILHVGRIRVKEGNNSEVLGGPSCFAHVVKRSRDISV